MKAIVIESFGGPEVLQLRERETPTPGPGQVLVRQEAIGVNFIDVYRRAGLYPVALPSLPGMEGAGTVEALGPDVRGLRAGDRVAYAKWGIHVTSPGVSWPHAASATALSRVLR